MKYFGVVFAICGPLLLILAESRLRWCTKNTKEMNLCQEMSRNLMETKTAEISCLESRHVFDCMRMIKENKADIINLNAEQIFVAGKYFNLKPILFERIENSTVFSDDVVVVVKKLHYFAEGKTGLQDLQAKRICLSGADEFNLQYQALVNVLFPLGLAKVYRKQCRSTIPSLAQFFNYSCVPGEWTSDSKLGGRYRDKLCKLCKSTCSQQDYFAGNEGALRCLINNQADAAVTSSKAVKNLNLDPNSYELLCIQGTRKNLTKPCEWMGRRTNALVISSNSFGSSGNSYKKTILKIVAKFGRNETQRPKWLDRIVLSGSDVKSLEDVYFHNTYEKYLGPIFVRSMESRPLPKIDCGEPMALKWCVHTKEDLEKCREMTMAFLTKRFRPFMNCQLAKNHVECLQWTKQGITDLTIARSNEVLEARRLQDLIPVAAEIYSDGSDASLYGLAVVNRGSNFSIDNLMGTKSCHPGANDVLGWQGPLHILQSKGYINIKDCDYAQAAGSFFWESCVPEIGTYGKHKHNYYDNLCSLCGNKCNSESPYFGPAGAIKCLGKGLGDVAFVDNQTLLQNIKLADQYFELLCLNGTRASVRNYQQCYWLKIPSKIIVVSKISRTDDEDRRRITQLLMKAQEIFGKNFNDDVDNNFFSIFATPLDPRTIFTFNTVKLKPVWPEDTLNDVLGSDYVGAWETSTQCSAASMIYKEPCKTILISVLLSLNLFQVLKV
uniref:Transferrin-like domain-containing protein n=1 Tax=Romanomermis culicivorax TaxID=13658 RepID=A0A915IM53_ROMCU